MSIICHISRFPELASQKHRSINPFLVTRIYERVSRTNKQDFILETESAGITIFDFEKEWIMMSYEHIE